MPRKTSFWKDAESVQKVPGARILFKALKRGIVRRYFDFEDKKVNDDYLLANYVLDWEQIQDDAGHDLPSPKDEPAVLDELYRDEVGVVINLLLAGPDPESPN